MSHSVGGFPVVKCRYCRKHAEKRIRCTMNTLECDHKCDCVNFIISKNYLGNGSISYKYFCGDGNLPRYSKPGKVYSVRYLSLSNNTQKLCWIFSTELGMTWWLWTVNWKECERKWMWLMWMYNQNILYEGLKKPLRLGKLCASEPLKCKGELPLTTKTFKAFCLLMAKVGSNICCDPNNSKICTVPYLTNAILGI